MNIVKEQWQGRNAHSIRQDKLFIFFELWSAKSYCVSHLILGRNQKAGTKSGEMHTEMLLSVFFFCIGLVVVKFYNRSWLW
jgi:hypothetical protein